MKKMNVSLVPSALKIQHEITAGMKVYNSPEFAATINVLGVDPITSSLFKAEFLLTENDPEFKIMLNDYITRKIAEKNFAG